jgi:hypothetical protein
MRSHADNDHSVGEGRSDGRRARFLAPLGVPALACLLSLAGFLGQPSGSPTRAANCLQAAFVKDPAASSRLDGAVIGISQLETFIINSANQACNGTATYQATMTGYAFGNQTGADTSHDLAQGDFANHPPNACYDQNDPNNHPKDSSGDWPWGTAIQLDSPTTVTEWEELPNGKDESVDYAELMLHDNGDPGCTQGYFWVDIYFGRFKQVSQSCVCSGSPNGVCTDSHLNNCQDATNWGSVQGTYEGPQ